MKVRFQMMMKTPVLFNLTGLDWNKLKFQFSFIDASVTRLPDQPPYYHTEAAQLAFWIKDFKKAHLNFIQDRRTREGNEGMSWAELGKSACKKNNFFSNIYFKWGETTLDFFEEEMMMMRRETIFVADEDDEEGLGIGNSSRRLITINFTKEEFQLVPSHPLSLFLSQPNWIGRSRRSFLKKKISRKWWCKLEIWFLCPVRFGPVRIARHGFQADWIRTNEWKETIVRVIFDWAYHIAACYRKGKETLCSSISCWLWALIAARWMGGSNVKLEHRNGRTDGWMEWFLFSSATFKCACLLAPISTSYPVDWFSCCLFWLQLQLQLFYLSSFFRLMNKLQMLQIFQNFRLLSSETNQQIIHHSFELLACWVVTCLLFDTAQVPTSARVVAGQLI